MGFFNRSRDAENEEPSRRYLTMAPPGPRTDNLGIACIQRITDEALTASSCFGEPLPPAALQPATLIVREVMLQDQDLSAWLVRKMVVILQSVIDAGMTGDAVENLDLAFSAGGLEIRDTVHVMEPAGAGLSEVDHEAARGFGVIVLGLVTLVGNPQASWEPDQRKFYENLYTGQDGQNVEDLAYDIVAWIAVVIARLHNAGKVRTGLPVFDPVYRDVPQLWTSGWYPNPPKYGDTSSGDAQLQRYWDGERWTSRVRIRQGRAWSEGQMSLHDAPTD